MHLELNCLLMENLLVFLLSNLVSSTKQGLYQKNCIGTYFNVLISGSLLFGDAWVGSIRSRNAQTNDTTSVEIHKDDSDISGRLDQSDDLQWRSYETDKAKNIFKH